MSTPDTAPETENTTRPRLAVPLLRGLGLVVLMAAVGLGSAFLAVELRMNTAVATAEATAGRTQRPPRADPPGNRRPAV